VSVLNPCSSPAKQHLILVSRLEVVIWRVPSLIGNAVAVSIVGVLVRSKLGSGPREMSLNLRALAWTYLPNCHEPCCSHPTKSVADGSVSVLNDVLLLFSNCRFPGSIGWIAGLGQAGSALIPFTTGALAASSGIWTLHPLYDRYGCAHHRLADV
jgi:hypothetical protein